MPAKRPTSSLPVVMAHAITLAAHVRTACARRRSAHISAHTLAGQRNLGKQAKQKATTQVAGADGPLLATTRYSTTAHQHTPVMRACNARWDASATTCPNKNATPDRRCVSSSGLQLVLLTLTAASTTGCALGLDVLDRRLDGVLCGSVWSARRVWRVWWWWAGRECQRRTAWLTTRAPRRPHLPACCSAA
jgi:hypothetical protein